MPLPVETTISHYRIISKLGAGGMGEVYLAADTRLDRKVALKILPEQFTKDESRLRRFVQEAKATSALNHPNIITIHEIGEAPGEYGGTHFIASEFIDGHTLRGVMTSGQLQLSDALDIALQVASALAAAHDAGIVHRDIKPENVIVRPDSLVKVLDFGLAKLTARPSDVNPSAVTALRVDTEAGVVMGTAHYMSPEQARGQEIDARTDIFSFGVVLYEMIAGRLPFQGSSVSDVIASILTREPLPLSRFVPEAPPELLRIVSKSLEKDREERYQVVKDLLLDLKRLKKRLEFEAERVRSGDTATTTKESVSPKAVPAPSSILQAIDRPRAKVGLVALSLIAIALTIGGLVYSRRGAAGATVNSLAILPLDNIGGGDNTEYLSDGITESLINDLSQISSLRVLARSTVFRYKGRAADPLTVGHELGVEAVLTGRLEQRGETLVVQADLVKVADGSQLWGGRFNSRLSDILALQSELSREIAGKLRPRLTGEEKRRLAKDHTRNAVAYQLYLNGRFYSEKRTPEALNRAIEYFGDAIERDPNYGLSYAGLADAYSLLGVFHLPPKEAFPKAREAALNALRIDETLGEAHAALGHIKVQYEYDWSGAEREYLRAIELNPNYANAHHFYALYLAIMGRVDEGLAEIRRAQELEPFSLFIHANVGTILCQGRRYGEAINHLNRVLEMNPNLDHARGLLGFAYAQKGMYEQAIAEFQKRNAPVSGGSASGGLAEPGATYALSGRRRDALKEIDKLLELSKQRYVAPLNLALIYAALGDKDSALEWLERAYQDRSTRLVWIKAIRCWIIFAPIRASPNCYGA